MNDDLTKLARFFRLYGSRLTESQRRNIRLKLHKQGTERSGPSTKPPGVLKASTPKEGHFSQFDKRERGAKLIKMAKKTLRTDHIGLRDPKDVRNWIIEPGSRKYHGHTERYHADPEYAQQCHENGTVDSDGKLAQWVSEANDGGWRYKDYEVVVNEENQQAAKGGGKASKKGKPSKAPARSKDAPIQWNSKKQTRTAESSAEVSWTASSSSGSYRNYSTWNR